jgi:hypothetical protein
MGVLGVGNILVNLYEKMKQDRELQDWLRLAASAWFTAVIGFCVPCGAAGGQGRGVRGGRGAIGGRLRDTRAVSAFAAGALADAGGAAAGDRGIAGAPGRNGNSWPGRAKEVVLSVRSCRPCRLKRGNSSAEPPTFAFQHFAGPTPGPTIPESGSRKIPRLPVPLFSTTHRSSRSAPSVFFPFKISLTPSCLGASMVLSWCR